MVAPCEEGYGGSYMSDKNKNNATAASHHHHNRPPRLSMETLQRTISDISWEISKEEGVADGGDNLRHRHHHAIVDHTELASIPEVEDAKCECCGLSEECTQEYIKRVRDEFSGRLICGLCAEAVNQEMEKIGGKREEALNEHMSACIRFNSLGRAYPVLCQAEAMREILKRNRAKSLSPKINTAQMKGVNLARSSSCMPAFTKEIKSREMVN